MECLKLSFVVSFVVASQHSRTPPEPKNVSSETVTGCERTGGASPSKSFLYRVRYERLFSFISSCSTKLIMKSHGSSLKIKSCLRVHVAVLSPASARAVFKATLTEKKGPWALHRHTHKEGKTSTRKYTLSVYSTLKRALRGRTLDARYSKSGSKVNLVLAGKFAK